MERRSLEVPRRRALAALAAGSASLAGCSNPLSAVTGPSLVDRGTRWAPDYESAAMSGVEAGFVAVDGDEFMPPLPDTTRDHLDRQWVAPVFDRSMTAIDTYIADVRGWGHVYDGIDDVVDVLESRGFEQDGSYEGFDMYLHPEGPTVAVDGSMAVVAAFTANTEVMLDVAEGDRPGSVETTDALSRLVDLTESRPYVRAFVHRPADPDAAPYAGQIGRSDAVSVSAEQYHARTVLLFEEPAQIDVDAIRSEVSKGAEDAEAFIAEVSSLEVSSRGRHVVVRGTGPINRLLIDTDWDQ
jgi:hypothetical protein